MRPYYEDSHVTVHNADVLAGLRALPDGSVHCCVTSPPYWGLRDYGEDGQIGLESTPGEYVARMVEVFREVRRVLRDDGTLWLNLGDSYAGSGPSGASYQSETTKRRAQGDGMDGKFRVSNRLAERGLSYLDKKPVAPPGLKPKDLVGIPWRVAFALQADGWWLRSDIIWHKPNPMPESVTDRPTKAHEYVFLLSKSERYYYDAEAIAEDAIHAGRIVKATDAATAKNGQKGDFGRTAIGFTEHDTEVAATRNRRSVWTIATKPYPEAHFATFPPELPTLCIKAGTSEGGVCVECGAPRERVVEGVAPDGRRGAMTKGGKFYDTEGRPLMGDNMIDHGVRGSFNAGKAGEDGRRTIKRETTGWRPTCDCEARTEGGTVLDPFAGSGTTLWVAKEHGRKGVGIELSADYCGLMAQRCSQGVLGLAPANPEREAEKP